MYCVEGPVTTKAAAGYSLVMFTTLHVLYARSIQHPLLQTSILKRQKCDKVLLLLEARFNIFFNGL